MLKYKMNHGDLLPQRPWTKTMPFSSKFLSFQRLQQAPEQSFLEEHHEALWKN